MSYLKFDKNLLINLDQSLPKEMLRTNMSGAYHCTTLPGCNTRKQHGLLVIPIKELGNKSYVMLSSLDETVIQHGAPFNLGLHRYQGGVYSPNGHKYIREFDCESVPRMTYRVGGVILTKEKVFISHENRILIRYTLVEAHSPTTLRFKPFLAFRESNSLCVANDAVNREIEQVDNGIGTCLYPGFPTLYMQFSRKPVWVDEPNWYNGIEYVKDMERGVPYCEDLWVPGYFEIPIKKGESIIFSAGVEPVKPRSLAKMYDNEVTTRTPRSSFFNCLKNSAKQFYAKDGKDMYVISGFPWGVVLARNTFMALPGLTLAIDHRADFEAIMDTASAALQRFMVDGQTDERIAGIDLPDIPLWCVWALQQYAKSAGMQKAREKYGRLLMEIVDYILADRHPNLSIDPASGLLETDGSRGPVSWMNSVIDGRPVVYRSGRLVEFNGLWYNALGFVLALTEGWEQADPARRQRKTVLDVVTRELLTPKGLRTLSPKSYGYRPAYLGSPREREEALHQGPARPWLMGFYADAYLKVFGMSGVGYIDRMLIGFEDDMATGCIGSLSQLYDGNPPFSGRGAVSHATNVAEVLRTIRTLKKFES